MTPMRRLRRYWLTLSTRLRNRLRRRYRDIDYVQINLPPALPELPEARGWLRQQIQGRPPMSLWELDRFFQRIAADPHPRGVILRLSEPAMSLASLQTLTGMIARLRAAGKRVVCYAQGYSTGAYFIASACDDILLQPGGDLHLLGLRQQALFLKDALDLVGVSLDVVAISPYKGAFDQFSRADASPEGREQLEWLIESRYQQVVAGIAAGRKLTPDAVRQMIDDAPHLGDDARTAGWIDGLMQEEDLPAHLGIRHIVTLKDADRRLILLPRREGRRSIAILPVRGLMIPGESGEPPGGIDLPIPFIGGSRAGDQTVVRHARRLLKDDSCAAVILYLDSQGGAAIAAEAMTAALDKLAAKRPVIAYMHSVAASGGYYVTTAARWVVAQPGTITGSIGVVTAKPVTGGLRDRLHVRTLDLTRGANADLYGDSAPFSAAQRAKVRASIESIYGMFVGRVARARGLTPEAVDAVGGGRVWTGAQALDHKLVDELGGIEAALAKARQLASLPDDAPIHLILGKGKPQPPIPTSAPAAAVASLASALGASRSADVLSGAAGVTALTYLIEGIRAVAGGTAQTILPVWVE